MTKKSALPLAAMEKLLKLGGPARVSDKAKETFRDVLDDIADKIAQNAIKIAAHSGRKTVKGSDVRLAAKL